MFYSPTLVATDNQRALAALGVHQYTLPECTIALAALRRITQFRARWSEERDTRPALRRLPEAQPTLAWGPVESAELLTGFGIPLPAQGVATTPGDACRLAARIGYPVALKIQSVDIAHKSDVGGVVLGIEDGAGLLRAYADVAAAVAKSAPAAAIDGMLVQKMSAKGREFAIGVVRDRDFGPLLMLAAGGVLIEVLDDAVFAPLPLHPGDPARMLDALKSARLLRAVRGDPPADRAALEKLLFAISRLVEAHAADIDEIEFNPVLVHPEGKGVSVVDFLIVQRTDADGAAHQ